MKQNITQKTPNVKLEKTKQLLTNNAGLVPILNAIHNADAFKDLIKPFRHMKQRTRGFSVAEKFLTMFAHAYTGAQRLEELYTLRNDKALQVATGVDIMAPTTASEFLCRSREIRLQVYESFRFFDILESALEASCFSLF